MKNWPYADFAHINADHLLLRNRLDPTAREDLTVDTVFPSASEDLVMFFDHYADAYKSRRSDLSEYLERLSADGWKLTTAGPIVHGKSYRFRRLSFRRTLG